jgi:hypothetical protein
MLSHPEFFRTASGILELSSGKEESAGNPNDENDCVHTNKTQQNTVY